MTQRAVHGCGYSDFLATGVLSLRRAFLRRCGWVPFADLNNNEIWVGPNGELETKDDAYELELLRHD